MSFNIQVLRAMLLAFLFPALLQAQPMEGRIRYLVVHDWVKKFAALDYISKQQRERYSYMWGKNSEWKVYTEMYFSENAYKYFDSEERAEQDDEGYSWRRNVYQINRNLKDNTMTDAIQMLGKTYLIEDTIRAADWKIQNDMKEIAGHVCMNAFMTDTLKKQKISVWFALDMPVSAGPERLYGLPGLILEADYNDGAMTITANKIELKKLTTELDLPKKQKGKKIKEAEYLHLLKEYINDKRKEEEPWFWGGVRY
jgi:GLPGLI family protein